MKNYPASLVEKAKALCQQMTVVKDCLIAMETGGVTAMHDATEGGVMGGLFEVASASKVGMEIDESRFIYPEEVRMVCEAFSIDSVAAIAEGSLIITARPGFPDNILERLSRSGIRASVIGLVTDDPDTTILKRRDGSIDPLKVPTQDPFWPVFFEGLAK